MPWLLLHQFHCLSISVPDKVIVCSVYDLSCWMNKLEMLKDVNVVFLSSASLNALIPSFPISLPVEEITAVHLISMSGTVSSFPCTPKGKFVQCGVDNQCLCKCFCSFIINFGTCWYCNTWLPFMTKWNYCLMPPRLISWSVVLTWSISLNAWHPLDSIVFPVRIESLISFSFGYVPSVPDNPNWDPW